MYEDQDDSECLQDRLHHVWDEFVLEALEDVLEGNLFKHVGSIIMDYAREREVLHADDSLSRLKKASNTLNIRISRLDHSFLHLDRVIALCEQASKLIDEDEG
jgi:hypothetical protein